MLSFLKSTYRSFRKSIRLMQYQLSGKKHGRQGMMISSGTKSMQAYKIRHSSRKLTQADFHQAMVRRLMTELLNTHGFLRN